MWENFADFELACKGSSMHTDKHQKNIGFSSTKTMGKHGTSRACHARVACAHCKHWTEPLKNMACVRRKRWKMSMLVLELVVAVARAPRHCRDRVFKHLQLQSVKTIPIEVSSKHSYRRWFVKLISMKAATFLKMFCDNFGVC